MIIGIGCDIVQVERIKHALTQKGFKERVFTELEQAYCTGGQGPRYESYAARFAAKEAVLKALGTGLRGGSLQEINITNDELGRPSLELSGHFLDLANRLGVTWIHLSLSHTKEAAIAQVVLEARE